MDELEISGKRYISTRLAGKEHKYHSDYIGQLIRGGKVTGQKVGRSWYVEAESLAEYLGKEVPPRGPMKKEPKAAPAPAIKQESEEIVEEEIAEPFALQESTEAIKDSKEEQSEAAKTAEEEKEIEEQIAEVHEEIFVARNILMPRPLQVEHKEKEAEKKPAKDTEEQRSVPITIVSPRLNYKEESKPVFSVFSAKKKMKQVSEPAAGIRPVQKLEEREPEVRPDPIPRQVRRTRILAPALTIVIAGGVALLIIAVISGGIISNTTIKNGQPASTWYSFNPQQASF